MRQKPALLMSITFILLATAVSAIEEFNQQDIHGFALNNFEPGQHPQFEHAYAHLEPNEEMQHCQEHPEECQAFMQHHEMPSDQLQEKMEWCKEHPQACAEKFGTPMTKHQENNEHRETSYPNSDYYRSDQHEEHREVNMPNMHLPDPAEMAMSSIFAQAKNMNPADFLQYCPDAKALVEAAVARLQEQGITIAAHCDKIQEYAEKCTSVNPCEHVNDQSDTYCNSNEEQAAQECMKTIPENANEETRTKIQEECKSLAAEHQRQVQEHCSKRDSMIQECATRHEEQCRKIEEAKSQCSTITPDQIKEAMTKRAEQMCSMKERFGHENTEDMMKHMHEMKEQLPEEIKTHYAEALQQVETAAHENTNDDSILSIIARLLGLKKKTAETAKRLEESINNLKKISEEINDPNTQAALQVQIKNLDEQLQGLKASTQEAPSEPAVGRAVTGFFLKVGKFFHTSHS